jgi:MSHA biogenesis protein MshP
MRNLSRQSGFALPIAIFLLVVLGGLSAWLMRLTGATLAQEGLELEGARAFQAAATGLEAGIYAARVGGSCASQTLTFTGELARFTSTVSCASSTADEGGTPLTFFAITSTACNQPAAGACPNPTPSLPEYAERQMRAVVEQ